MSFKVIPPKLAKKDLLALYDITHPTLRSWLRRAGLAEFIGRRRFLAHEVVLIFQALGRPRLARTAAQRLKDVYARFKGHLPDEVRFREKYQQALPAQRQDRYQATEEELDAEPIFPLEGLPPSDKRHLADAIGRLTVTAILLLGQKARKRAQEARALQSKRLMQRKRLGKHRSSRLRAA